MLNIEKINSRFKKLGEAILKFRILNIIVFALILVTAGAGLRLLKTDTNQDHWFLEGDSMLLAKERFESIFGNDDFCAVLVTAENVFTPAVLSKIRELGRELVTEVPYTDDILSLTDFDFTLGTEEGMEIIDLVPKDIPASPVELARIKTLAMSKPALKNRIVSEDGRETWIMLRLKPTPKDWQERGEENPELVIGRKVNEIVGQEKYRILQPRTTGLPVIDVEKRDFIAGEMPRLFGISLLLTMVVLAVSLRSVRGVFFPLAASASSIIIVFGAQGYLGIRNDPSMIFLPVFLSMALSTGYSIHILNFFKRKFKETGQRHTALVHAIEETGWPLLFSALTTMAALLSFLFIPLRPIRWVGLTAAALVAITFILVIVLLPSLLSFGKDREPCHVNHKNAAGALDRMLDFLGSRILTRPQTTLIVFSIVTLACLAGITRFEVSFDIRRTFGLDVPYVQRISDIGQTTVGSLYSYGVALEFEHADAAKDPANLRKLEQLITEIDSFPLTKKVSSILDIVKDMNQVLNSGDPSFYKIPDDPDMIAQLLLLYENAGGAETEKWIDYDYQRLRLMVEVDDYNSGEAVRELRKIQHRCRTLFPDANLLLTGSLSQFTVMMDYVTWGQIKSFFIALIVVSLLMSIVFGSWRIGVIGMIPNVAPALAVGGIMGFAGIPLDIMTVTIIPMLLGVSVDDTIHFINHSQLEFLRTGSYRESSRRVFTSVGKAMFLTSTVLILNFSAYLTSAANVFVNMGFLVSAGILAALAADFFVTPVLLKSMRSFGAEVPKSDISTIFHKTQHTVAILPNRLTAEEDKTSSAI